MKKQSNILPGSFHNPFIVFLSFAALTLALLVPTFPAHSAEVTLAWNSVPESSGYKLYYGSESRVYHTSKDVGGQTSHTLNVDSGTYYLAVTAYNIYGESGFSEELPLTIEEGASVAHVVIASAGDGGNISPSGEVPVEDGAEQTFAILPDENYHISDVLVDGASVDAVSSYTFTDVTRDATIEATFAVNTHTISASAGENGNISPYGNIIVNQGSNQNFIISPNPGCHVADVLVDGVSVGTATSYTFSNVMDSHSIEVLFAIDIMPTCVITVSTGEHGNISPSGSITVVHGAEQTFTIVPDENYHIADVLVDGASVGAVSSYAFSDVTMDTTIAATFAVNTHTITASAGENGNISPSGNIIVNQGSNQTFIITPDYGYYVSDVLVDGASVGASAGYTFYDVTGSRAIFASFVSENQSPKADAGPDQSVDEGVIVTLSGTNSSDPDPGDGIASYLWEQIEGQTVDLFDSNTDVTTFEVPDVDSDGEAFVFRLTVADNSGLESSDTCIVNVSSVNVRPIADAGANQDVNEGDTVVLDGSGSMDPDYDGVTYLWEQTEGPDVELSDITSVQPSFTAPDISSDGVSITFQLTVKDTGELKSTDTCIVNVLWINIPPVADAGPDQTAVEEDSISLNGSGSTDPDDVIASYRWVQTEGYPVTLSDPAAVNPTFSIPDMEQSATPYVFQLTVKDSGGLEDSDTCAVNATSAASFPPIPDIKANGQDGPIAVSSGDTVSITVNLDPGVDYANTKVEWWISVLSPGDVWSSYNWRKDRWVDGIKSSIRERIKAVYREVLNADSLPPGKYMFYFAVDDNSDKIPDSTWSDGVEVYVEESLYSQH